MKHDFNHTQSVNELHKNLNICCHCGLRWVGVRNHSCNACKAKDVKPVFGFQWKPYTGDKKMTDQEFATHCANK